MKMANIKIAGKEIICDAATGAVSYNFGAGEVTETDMIKQLILKDVYNIWNHPSKTIEDKVNYFNKQTKKVYPDAQIDISRVDMETGAIIDDSAIKTDIASKLIAFFSEFAFEPNYRFMNTLSFAAHNNKTAAIAYVNSYFELSGNSYANAVSEKMKSAEFSSIMTNMKKISEPTNRINKRFKLWYGSQGTGKTTEAVNEASGNCVVCHSGMLPQDLMEDFVFEEGKPAFQKSAMYIAMEEGKKIVLDEINLLPFESLRFLQTILDNKERIEYKGRTIEIKDGFEIIGTMNLKVNGAIYALPEPLIDRASELRCTKLTPKMLAEAL